MSSEIIKKHLEEMKTREGLDREFVEILSFSNEKNEDGKETAAKVLALIKKRYAENKENNA